MLSITTSRETDGKKTQSLSVSASISAWKVDLKTCTPHCMGFPSLAKLIQRPSPSFSPPKNDICLPFFFFCPCSIPPPYPRRPAIRHAMHPYCSFTRKQDRWRLFACVSFCMIYGQALVCRILKSICLMLHLVLSQSHHLCFYLAVSPTSLSVSLSLDGCRIVPFKAKACLYCCH